MKIKFLYHAQAVAASGFITLPYQETMEIQGSVAVPLTGGHGAVHVDHCRHRNIFSFTHADSHVVGSYSAKDKAYGTLAATTVEGLNIMDAVTCDRVVLRLTTKHPEDGSEPSLIALGSRFENLRIAGHKIEVDLATDTFAEHHTWSRLKDAHATKPKVKEELRKLATYPPKDDEFPGSKGMFAGTLARNLDDLPGGLKRNGTGIHVPHFGTVYLAQYFTSPAQHRLVMMYVELGCSVEGAFDIGSGDTNGGWPPFS